MRVNYIIKGNTRANGFDFNGIGTKEFGQRLSKICMNNSIARVDRPSSNPEFWENREIQTSSYNNVLLICSKAMQIPPRRMVAFSQYIEFINESAGEKNIKDDFSDVSILLDYNQSIADIEDFAEENVDIVQNINIFFQDRQLKYSFIPLNDDMHSSLLVDFWSRCSYRLFYKAKKAVSVIISDDDEKLIDAARVFIRDILLSKLPQNVSNIISISIGASSPNSIAFGDTALQVLQTDVKDAKGSGIYNLLIGEFNSYNNDEWSRRLGKALLYKEDFKFYDYFMQKLENNSACVDYSIIFFLYKIENIEDIQLNSIDNLKGLFIEYKAFFKGRATGDILSILQIHNISREQAIEAFYPAEKRIINALYMQFENNNTDFLNNSDFAFLIENYLCCRNAEVDSDLMGCYSKMLTDTLNLQGINDFDIFELVDITSKEESKKLNIMIEKSLQQHYLNIKIDENIINRLLTFNSIDKENYCEVLNKFGVDYLEKNETDYTLIQKVFVECMGADQAIKIALDHLDKKETKYIPCKEEVILIKHNIKNLKNKEILNRLTSYFANLYNNNPKDIEEISLIVLEVQISDGKIADAFNRQLMNSSPERPKEIILLKDISELLYNGDNQQLNNYAAFIAGNAKTNKIDIMLWLNSLGYEYNKNMISYYFRSFKDKEPSGKFFDIIYKELEMGRISDLNKKDIINFYENNSANVNNHIEMLIFNVNDIWTISDNPKCYSIWKRLIKEWWYELIDNATSIKSINDSFFNCVKALPKEGLSYKNVIDESIVTSINKKLKYLYCGICTYEDYRTFKSVLNEIKEKTEFEIVSEFSSDCVERIVKLSCNEKIIKQYLIINYEILDDNTNEYKNFSKKLTKLFIRDCQDIFINCLAGGVLEIAKFRKYVENNLVLKKHEKVAECGKAISKIQKAEEAFEKISSCDNETKAFDMSLEYVNIFQNNSNEYDYELRRLFLITHHQSLKECLAYIRAACILMSISLAENTINWNMFLNEYLKIVPRSITEANYDMFMEFKIVNNMFKIADLMDAETEIKLMESLEQNENLKEYKKKNIKKFLKTYPGIKRDKNNKYGLNINYKMWLLNKK